MNWIEIKEKYPRAFNNWFEYEFNKAKGYKQRHFFSDRLRSKYSELRNLYDFFDDNNIMIEVYMTMWSKTEWESDIYFDEHQFPSIVEKHISRTECESAAFTKAFELLESKLK